MSAGSRAAVVGALAISLLGCAAAPDAATDVPTSAPASPSATAPATQAQPTAGTPAPPAATASPDATVTDPPAGPTETSVRGTWLGTVTSNGQTQGIRFLLRDIGGVISGTALWDSGKIDNGLRGGFEGDVLRLDDSLTSGINIYEGTFEGDVFSGTHTTDPRPAGQEPSTFEVQRQP